MNACAEIAVFLDLPLRAKACNLAVLAFAWRTGRL
jgi:hypothetical protein